VEDTIIRYIREVQTLNEPSDEEIAAVQEAIAESDWEDAQGIEITLDEVEAELDLLIETYQPNQTSA